MRQIREVLRLHFESGRSIRQIKASTNTSVGVIQKLLKRHRELNLTWPLSADQPSCMTRLKRPVPIISIPMTYCQSFPAPTWCLTPSGTSTDLQENGYRQSLSTGNVHTGNWEKQIEVVTQNCTSEYTPVPKGTNLDAIFVVKDYRKIRTDHTFSYGNKFYLIESPLRHSIAKQKIEIRVSHKDGFDAYFADRELVISEVIEPTKPSMLDLDI